MSIPPLSPSQIQAPITKPIQGQKKIEAEGAFEAYIQNLSKMMEKPSQEPVEFITWIALGIDVVVQRFFPVNDKLSDELFEKGSRAIKVKLRRDEYSDQKEFLVFWGKHYETLLTNIIGTLLLEDMACRVILAQLYEAMNKQDDSAINICYLRLKISTKTFDTLNTNPKEKEAWKKVVADLEKEASSISSYKKEAALAEFVAYHLIKCDIASLEGKNLKGIFSKEYHKTYDYARVLVEKSLTNEEKIEHDSTLNAASLLSGTFGALVKNPARGEVYFSAMLDYLNKYNKSPCDTKLQPSQKDIADLAGFLKKHHLEVPTNLISITSLDLSGLHLKELPSCFALLSNLRTLNLSTNEFTKVPEVLLNLQELKVLILNGNQLTAIPEEVAEKLPQLNRLDILENPIKEVPSNLKKIVWQLPFLASWKS